MKKSFLSEMTFQTIGGYGIEIQSTSVHVFLFFFLFPSEHIHRLELKQVLCNFSACLLVIGSTALGKLGVSHI